MSNKAFSVVEVLFTLVLVGVLSGIGVVAYRNIQSRAEEAAHNKDQVVLQQVIESFRITGGNMAGILASTDLSAREKAAALTLVLQQGLTADAYKASGTVTTTLGSDMVIVPYTGTDKARLLASPVDNPVTLTLLPSGTPNPGEDVGGAASGVTMPSPGTPQLQTFVVTKKTSTLGAQANLTPTEQTNAANAANAVRTASAIGAHYAVGSSYLWNEDASTTNSSALSSVNDTNPSAGVVGLPGAVNLRMASTFSGNSGVYTYDDYQGTGTATATYYVFREDGKPLYTEDVTFGGVSIKVLMNTNTSSPQFTYNPISTRVPSSLTGGLGEVIGLKFDIKLKDLLAFGTYQPNAEALNYLIRVPANPTDKGRMGRPGMAPIASGIVFDRNITVGRPTKLKLAFAFDKTGSKGDGLTTAVVANMVDAPATGDDFSLTPDKVQDGWKVDYIYRYYQFGKPTAENIADKAVAYVAVYRDDGKPVAANELDDLVLTYNGRDLSSKAKTLTDVTASGKTISGAPAGTATFSFVLPDNDGIPVSTTSPSAQAIAKAQTGAKFTLALKKASFSTTGIKGSQSVGSLIDTDASASAPVYVNVNAKTAKLIVKRNSGDSWIRYATFNDKTNLTSDYTYGANKDVTVLITRSDGVNGVKLTRSTDIDTTKSQFKIAALNAGAGTNGVQSNKWTLGQTALGGSYTGVPSNAVLQLSYQLAPLSSVTQLPLQPDMWPTPQVQLQFYVHPSAPASVGDQDRDPILVPPASTSTFDSNSPNVARILLFADWKGALPYNGSPTQTAIINNSGIGEKSDLKQ